jgi:Type IV secretion system pilin
MVPKIQNNLLYYIRYMFSKLIKIISAASLFLVLGVAMTVSPTVNAFTAAECAAQGLGVNVAGQCGVPNTGAGTNGPVKVPGATELCGGSCPITGANSTPINSQQGVVALLIRVARFLSYISVGIAVLVIIYGGYLYLNPADSKGAETGQKVLVNAAIGLAIAITAVTIVTILSGILTGSYF